jgi:MFS family permease
VYFGGILSYLPLHLRSMHGPNAGIFFTADALGVLLLRVPTGWLTDKYGSLLPEILGLGVTLPGIAILALHPTVPILIASGAMTGTGAGMFITGVYVNLANRSDESNRGTAMSLGSASFTFGIFTGSTISGVLVDPGGFNAILVYGFVTCAAALPFAVLPARIAAQEST